VARSRHLLETNHFSVLPVVAVPMRRHLDCAKQEMANGQKSEEEDRYEAQDHEEAREEALVRIAPGEQFVAAYNIATQIPN
jgi:hypothetical protein